MKDQKNRGGEFRGFASNPEKSFEAGKKGNRLAIENSIRNVTPTNPMDEHNTSSGTTNRSKPAAQGKGWQSIKGSSERDGKKDQDSSKEKKA